ncbi:MAG: hypothetical protein KDA20_07825 [Phycisphaerales bacterium]|nr:hypothetical protein [Phycisphaerales bacterium]
MSGACEIQLAWRSAHEVVLVKPAGLSCEIPNDVRGVSLIEQVRAGRVAGVQPCPDAKLPHRLDRVACGYMVVALTAEAIAHHNEQIAQNAWVKWYIVRVEGDAKALVGEQRAYIKRKGKRAELVRAGGQVARMDVLAAQPAPEHVDQSHALIRLHTGRYHQIRVMLAGLGAPLVGDAMYGGPNGQMYLEHVALRFEPYQASAITVFDEHSTGRERIAPAMLDVLKRAISEVK